MLVGSVRDDGPLPDVYTDVIEGQRAMRAAAAGVGFAIMVATMLHSIATGNLLPASIPLVCVDINPATVTKLADRGSAQAIGIVTDIGLFLEQLARELAPGVMAEAGDPRRIGDRAADQVGGADEAGLRRRARRRPRRGPGRNPRPGSARSSRSRAGPSTISPSSLTPPPMTTTSGSRTAARSAMPCPSQAPTSVTSSSASGSPSGGGAARRPHR